MCYRGKYLEYLKLLSSKWPHLQLLADFMEVGTTPVRWNSSVPGGYPIDNNQRRECSHVSYRPHSIYQGEVLTAFHLQKRRGPPA